MEAELPHEVTYQTAGPVALEEVIASLQGTLIIAQDHLGPLLEVLVPGLAIERITVSVSSISQASPLTEAFTLGVLAIFQDKLGADVPEIINRTFGVDLPKDYDNIVSLLFMVLVFYSCRSVYNAADRAFERPALKRQLDFLITDAARILGQEEQEIRAALEARYKKSGVGSLLSAAFKFLIPSKKQSNAPILVNRREIPHQAIAEFPGRAQIKDEEPGPITYPLENVEIQLHAQDLDRNRQGWAAVVPNISERRIPMSLMPPIQPAEIFTRDVIHGDVLVEAHRNGDGDSIANRIHLIRLRDGS